MHSPEITQSHAPRLSPAIVHELRTALLPAAPHPYGEPREQWLDNLVNKIQQDRARPHVHVPAILTARQDRGEPLETVLKFPRMLMGLLTARAVERVPLTLQQLQVEETRAESAVNEAQWRYEVERSQSALAELQDRLTQYHVIYEQLLAAVHAARAA